MQQKHIWWCLGPTKIETMSIFWIVWRRGLDKTLCLSSYRSDWMIFVSHQSDRWVSNKVINPHLSGRNNIQIDWSGDEARNSVILFLMEVAFVCKVRYGWASLADLWWWSVGMLWTVLRACHCYCMETGLDADSVRDSQYLCTPSRRWQIHTRCH